MPDDEQPEVVRRTHEDLARRHEEAEVLADMERRANVERLSDVQMGTDDSTDPNLPPEGSIEEFERQALGALTRGRGVDLSLEAQQRDMRRAAKARRDRSLLDHDHSVFE